MTLPGPRLRMHTATGRMKQRGYVSGARYGHPDIAQKAPVGGLADQVSFATDSASKLNALAGSAPAPLDPGLAGQMQQSRNQANQAFTKRIYY